MHARGQVTLTKEIRRFLDTVKTRLYEATFCSNSGKTASCILG